MRNNLSRGTEMGRGCGVLQPRSSGTQQRQAEALNASCRLEIAEGILPCETARREQVHWKGSERKQETW